jgi:hypothetical protein
MEQVCTKPSLAAAKWRSTVSIGATLVGLAAAASSQASHAGPLSIVTSENPAQPGAFTLDFGDLGVVARSNITSTTYELAIDPARGTARFVSYLQHVEPLVLPGGFSTGDITVEIVAGSSSGTFEPLTRTFTTSEQYAVHFTGDLSAFGLSSPVLLPSSSVGALAVDAGQGGEVVMDWDGFGQLANPFDPANPLTFTYRCAVNTLFPATPANMVGLALPSEVLSLQLPAEIEANLVALLDQALARVQRGKGARAKESLRAFIEKVDGLGGRLISEADALALIAMADETIDLIGSGRPSVRVPGQARK